MNFFNELVNARMYELSSKRPGCIVRKNRK